MTKEIKLLEKDLAMVAFDDYKIVLAMLYHALDDECGSKSTPWDNCKFREYANKYCLNEQTFNPDKVFPVY